MSDVVREAEVAIEVVLLGMTEEGLMTLLRPLSDDFAPHEAADTTYALPRGRLRAGELLDEAAARILASELGLDGFFVEQLFTFMRAEGAPCLRVAYYALVDARTLEAAKLEEGAGEPRLAPIFVPWEGETGGPVEALDHEGVPYALPDDDEDILGMAVKRVRGKLSYTPIGYQLLPARFTLLELQRVHETVLGRPFNKISFRRRMLGSGELEATGERQRDVGHRPAELYRFRSRSAV